MFKLLESSCVVALFMSILAQAEVVPVYLSQGVYSQGDKISLKQELRNQGINPEEFDLKAVTMWIEGDASMSLMIGNQEADRKRIQSDRFRKEELSSITLYNDGREKIVKSDSSSWQIISLDPFSISIHRIVLTIKRTNQGVANRNKSENDDAQTKRLASWF